jgi:hypothetical protein
LENNSQWKKCEISHLKATGTLHVHEKTVGALNKTLELVVAGFGGSVGVKQIFINLRKGEKISGETTSHMSTDEAMGN